ncbi:MAG: hypothetical protein QOJ52_2970 [Acidimicrobiaceae bacterium]|jgi:hypothetical protein|nr:hypothetical protein [Acidimicrobiaceae bacterium]
MVRRAAGAAAAVGLVLLSAGVMATPARANGSAMSGTSGDPRATAVAGNTVTCPPGQTQLLFRDGNKSGSVGAITVTTNDPFLDVVIANANGFTNPLNGTTVVVYVKGGPNYNVYNIAVGPNGATLTGLHSPYNGGGNIPTLSHYFLCQQGQPTPTSPACNLTALLSGPPVQLQVTVQDTNSGLASVVVTSVVNAAVNVPTFTAGTANAVVVTATKIDPSQPSSLAMRVTNTAGGVTDCDPPF